MTLPAPWHHYAEAKVPTEGLYADFAGWEAWRAAREPEALFDALDQAARVAWYAKDCAAWRDAGETMMPLPVGTLVRFRPYYPCDQWSPFRWRITGVDIHQRLGRPETHFYTLELVDQAGPLADTREHTCIRRDMIEPIKEAG